MKENKISSLIAHLFQGVFLLITAVLCVGPFVWVIFSTISRTLFSWTTMCKS